jgi:hypothetical protein
MNLDFLIERWSYWSLQKTAQEFYKDDINNPNINGSVKYAIEKFNQGFLISQPNSISFFDTTSGTVYRLDRQFSDKDFLCNLYLYEKSQSNSLFLVDQPLEYQKVKFKEDIVQYSVLQRPNQNIGIDIALDIGNQKYNLEYLELWIDKVSEIAPYVIEATKKHKSGFPGNGILVTDLLRLDYNYYWKGFRKWGVPFSDFKAKTENSLTMNAFLVYKFLSYQSSVNMKEYAGHVNSLLKQARVKWKNIL